MERRVVIVDFNHMVHTYMNSNYRLSKTLKINGEDKVIDTTVASGTIKSIHRWSHGGFFPTAVCFDSPVPVKKAYFAKNFDMPVGTDKAYKGGRAGMSDSMFESLALTQEKLKAGGVSCFKGQNYEADDLVFACIETAKSVYPGLKIDVVTNDADLLPLVDDTVSVFLRSKKMTWAETPELEKRSYIQVTPKNFQDVVQDLSDFRKFYMPYNSILLNKLLRGDNSDNLKDISRVSKLFPPKKYNEMVYTMESKGIDLSKLFRYGKCKEVFVSIKTGEVVDYNTHPKEDLAVRYDDPDELNELIDVLCWYIEDDEVLEIIKKLYRGINLNQAYNLGALARRPARLKEGMKCFNETELQVAVSPLDINLNLFVK